MTIPKLGAPYYFYVGKNFKGYWSADNPLPARNDPWSNVQDDFLFAANSLGAGGDISGYYYPIENTAVKAPYYMIAIAMIRKSIADKYSNPNYNGFWVSSSASYSSSWKWATYPATSTILPTNCNYSNSYSTAMLGGLSPMGGKESFIHERVQMFKDKYPPASITSTNIPAVLAYYKDILIDSDPNAWWEYWVRKWNKYIRNANPMPLLIRTEKELAEFLEGICWVYCFMCSQKTSSVDTYPTPAAPFTLTSNGGACTTNYSACYYFVFPSSKTRLTHFSPIGSVDNDVCGTATGSMTMSIYNTEGLLVDTKSFSVVNNGKGILNPPVKSALEIIPFAPGKVKNNLSTYIRLDGQEKQIVNTPLNFTGDITIQSALKSQNPITKSQFENKANQLRSIYVRKIKP